MRIFDEDDSFSSRTKNAEAAKAIVAGVILAASAIGLGAYEGVEALIGHPDSAPAPQCAAPQKLGEAACNQTINVIVVGNPNK